MENSRWTSAAFIVDVCVTNQAAKFLFPCRRLHPVDSGIAQKALNHFYFKCYCYSYSVPWWHCHGMRERRGGDCTPFCVETLEDPKEWWVISQQSSCRSWTTELIFVAPLSPHWWKSVCSDLCTHVLLCNRLCLLLAAPPLYLSLSCVCVCVCCSQ